MIVLGSDPFSESLSKELKARFVKIESSLFPDGESRLRVTEPERVRGEKAILVSRASTPLNPDKLIADSIILLDKINQLGPRKLCLFLPYQPYSRQDREFRRGETLSIKSVRKVLKERCNIIVNVASHDHREEGWIENGIYNIDPLPSVIGFLKGRKFRNPLVVSPDMGESNHITPISEALRGSVLSMKKERDRETGEIRMEGSLPSLNCRDVIIFDDMLSTGGTMIKAAENLKKAGTGSITCIVIHNINARDSSGRLPSERLKSLGAFLLSSDTMDSGSFSVIPQSAETLKRIF